MVLDVLPSFFLSPFSSGIIHFHAGYLLRSKISSSSDRLIGYLFVDQGAGKSSDEKNKERARVQKEVQRTGRIVLDEAPGRLHWRQRGIVTSVRLRFNCNKSTESGILNPVEGEPGSGRSSHRTSYVSRIRHGRGQIAYDASPRNFLFKVFSFKKYYSLLLVSPPPPSPPSQ